MATCWLWNYYLKSTSGLLSIPFETRPAEEWIPSPLDPVPFRLRLTFWSLDTVVMEDEDEETELAIAVLDATAAIVAAMLLELAWDPFPAFSESEELDVWCPFSLLLRHSLYYTHIYFNSLKYVVHGWFDKLSQVETLAYDKDIPTLACVRSLNRAA